MQKSFQRNATTGILPDEKSKNKTGPDAAEIYIDELREELSGSFQNSVYLKGRDAIETVALSPDEEEVPWHQLMLTEIHKQLLHGFARSAEAFGVDPALIYYDMQVHQDPEGEVIGVIIMRPEKGAVLPMQNQIACEKLFEFVEMLQSWVEENGDAEDGVFEILPGKGPDYLVINCEYQILYNALNAMVPELEGMYTATAQKISTIEESLNSALHVMGRYDTPGFRLN